MVEKEFYTLLCKGDITGVVKKKGFKAKHDGIKVYFYQSEAGMVYAISPDTGMYAYAEAFEGRLEEISESEEMRIIQESVKWIKRAQRKETYQLRSEIFTLYKKAAVKEEEYRRRMQGKGM